MQKESIGNASLVGSICNLAKVAVGAGLLTVPFAYNEAGLVGTTIIVGSCALLQVASLEALTYAVRHGGKTVSEAATNRGYAGIAIALYGEKVGNIVDFVQAVSNFGAVVSFLQISATEIGTFMMNNRQIGWLLGDSFNACRITGIWVASLVVVMPLASMKSMSSLQFTSVFGLFCVGVVLSVVMISFFWRDDLVVCGLAEVKDSNPKPNVDFGLNAIGGLVNCTDWDIDRRCIGDNQSDLLLSRIQRQHPKIWPSTFASVIRATTIIVFGFINQVQYIPILLELSSPTPFRTHSLIIGATAICFAADAVIGTFGYLTFCSRTRNCILDNYNINDKELGDLYIAARLCFMLSLLITCPLVIFPVRQSIISRYQTRKVRLGLGLGSPHFESEYGTLADTSNGSTYHDSSNEKSPLLSTSEGNGEDDVDACASSESSSVIRILVTCTIVLIGLILASIFDQLAIVIGIVGALGGGVIMYTIPAAMAYRVVTKHLSKPALHNEGDDIAVNNTVTQTFSLSTSEKARACLIITLGVFGIILSIMGTAFQFI